MTILNLEKGTNIAYNPLYTFISHGILDVPSFELKFSGSMISKARTQSPDEPIDSFYIVFAIIYSCLTDTTKQDFTRVSENEALKLIKKDLLKNKTVQINKELKEYMNDSSVIVDQSERMKFRRNITANNLDEIKTKIIDNISVNNGGKGARKKRRRKTKKRNARRSQRKSKKGRRKRKLRR
jgi:hypothetical protein